SNQQLQGEQGCLLRLAWPSQSRVQLAARPGGSENAEKCNF
ncbi:hypothetical protein A2U01_0085830, partial [Trifolium medium]|nr:hypothetical protein [Trifolium medium]